MDRCTGCHNITEILLKTALNTIQSINHGSFPVLFPLAQTVAFCRHYRLDHVLKMHSNLYSVSSIYLVKPI